MLTFEWGVLTSASLRDIRRSHSLGTHDFLDFTTIQCNMAHIFMDSHLETKDNISQILKKRAAAREQ